MWGVTRWWPQEKEHRFALDLETNIELRLPGKKPWVGEGVWRAILSSLDLPTAELPPTYSYNVSG